MAISNIGTLLLLLTIALAGILLPHNLVVAEDYPCNFRGIMGDCVPSLRKLKPGEEQMPPSEGCCNAVQHTDLTCACNKVNKYFEEIICMDKVVYIANYCKRPRRKCGSKKAFSDSSFLYVVKKYIFTFTFLNEWKEMEEVMVGSFIFLLIFSFFSFLLSLTR